MKYRLILPMVFITVFFIADVWGQNKDMDSEPSQIAYLKIDGKENKILIGKKSRVMIGDKAIDVTIKLDPYRIFNKSGLRFKYPSRMFFSFDNSDPNVLMWTIDGENSSIMVHFYKVAVDEKSIIDALKDGYLQLKAKVDVKEASFNTKNRILSGKQLDINMGKIKIHQEVYVMRMQSSTMALILQNAKKETGKKTDEYVSLIKAISESLEIRK